MQEIAAIIAERKTVVCSTTHRSAPSGRAVSERRGPASGACRGHAARDRLGRAAPRDRRDPARAAISNDCFRFIVGRWRDARRASRLRILYRRAAELARRAARVSAWRLRIPAGASSRRKARGSAASASRRPTRPRGSGRRRHHRFARRVHGRLDSLARGLARGLPRPGSCQPLQRQLARCTLQSRQ